jgi:DNA-binding MarR family transcriptional regulator
MRAISAARERETGAADERDDALYESLGALRRGMLREGLLAAIRGGEDLEISLVQLGALLLLEAEGERSIGEVAAELGRSLSAASRLLDPLVRRGLVTRREDALDRRVKRVAVTETGRALVGRIDRQRTAAQRAVMARLSPEERAEVERAMRLLADAAGRTTDERHPGGNRARPAAEH